jgi:flagellar L-ring protein precursor FlgH
MMKRRLELFVLLPIFLTACSTPLPKHEPSFSPVAPADLRPPPLSSGGIYQAGFDTRLFEDPMARRVGDVLTVQLKEFTTSNQSSNNKDNKQDSISLSLPTLFGLGGLLLGSDLKTSMESAKNFKGEGKNEQRNGLTSTMSVTVVELLPNGNLKVRGEKRISLNQGDEFVRLSGIVRPVDIGFNKNGDGAANFITSDKIADATFMYTSSGATADASSAGWLSRIFSSPWFPF